jgi:3-hydroxyacyl-CoA dehydrogenase/enoyl-CoA hydratase/3-hydroxybutyryl-CoA epimerase
VSGALRRELDDDGVLTLLLDLPGEKLNTLGKGLIPELERALAEVESDPEVRAVVLASGKPDSFIAGGDLRELRAVRSSREGEELARGAQAVLSRLERLPRPVVAAVHGSCLGGGLEVALACHYRVVSDDPRTRLGLPEVKLGLLPGAGGTWRLPRCVGLAAALEAILSGRAWDATRAQRAGLADGVVPAPRLLREARQAALDLVEGRLRLRRRGVATGERLARGWIARQARARVLRSAGPHYPAPLRAIDVVTRGAGLSQAAAHELEARAFGELAVSDVARALIALFFATREIEKDPGYPDETEPREVTRLVVVGAGLMGAGIAAAAADAGVAVRLRDRDHDALGAGLRAARAVFEERLRRGRLTRREVEQRLDRIAPATDASGAKRAELVIEAVFEDVELKRTLVAGLEERVEERCVIASNTSSLPIAEIAQGARRPERILGMHFFSPVHRMPLLEVVVTPENDAFAVATAVAFGRRLGKHVITVRDGPGFYTTRILAPYLNEAGRLLEEGARIEEVDGAMRAWGFPVGPLALLDEVGIDVGARVSAALADRLGARFAAPAAIEKLIGADRRGRKSGRGFYRYDTRADGPRPPDPEVYALLGDAERRAVPAREIQDRLAFCLVNEAVRCLEKEILRSPRDGDVGAVFGLGFPPFLGGPFHLVDRLGARYASELLERLEGRHGERFRPAALLVDAAKRGEAFHNASGGGGAPLR